MTGSSSSNEKHRNAVSLNETGNVLHCVDGIILPAWEPLINVGKGTVAFRGIVYIVVLIYLFVGVAILADKFMASIEMITSKKKEVKMRDRDGKLQTVVVRVWNETVANLTLMALGCSCPEILLSSIEIVGKGFEAGELGPGSTVGSAAFNLFVIIGVCNWAIPDGQVRRIKRVSVFLVTAAWSIFAYLWLYLITAVFSPGAIEVWEAVLTFLFFPMTVLSAYVADRHTHIYDYLSKTYRMGRNGVIVETTTDEAETVEVLTQRRDHFKKFAEESENQEVQEFEDHRRAFIILLKSLRRKYPDLKSNQLELMACKEMLDRGAKSSAFYKNIVSKLITGHSENAQNLDFTHLFQDFHQPTSPSSQMRNIDRQITKVFFSPGHYTVMENVGELMATVVREDGDLNQRIMVDYSTESGEAVAGKDFESAHGTIVFEPGVTTKTIHIQIIDDDLYEEDQHFYIRLFNLRTGNPREFLCGKGDISDDAYVTTADVHETAPSYSTTVDIEEIEDVAPPRYSVTAREILSALKQNKNLRRPSWFHYDESSHDDSDSSDDDVFEDAVSHLEVEIDVAANKDEEHRTLDNISSSTNDEMNGLSRNTSVVSVSSSNKISPFRPATTHPLQHTVGFSNTEPTFTSVRNTYCENSSDSDGEVFHPSNKNVPQHSLLRLVCPSLATVMILDDDHHGIFSLTECSVCLTETVGTYNANIMRCGGTRGKVALSYRTEEGTAKAGRDYQHIEGEIMFEDGESEKNIAIPIMLESLYEKDVVFYFNIGEPQLITESDTEVINTEQMSIRAYSQLTNEQRTALKGRPQLGEVTSITIRLKESKEFKNTVDKLMARASATIQKGRSSWKHQFIDALKVKEEEEGDDGGSLTAHSYTWGDYATHYVTLFWKIVFAVIPPECIGGGYPCFVACVVCIGVMTSLIGDIASHLGCTVGLKDSVTALAFVSLGTSLPDLFASKVSAVHNKHADASISNVTGSNAVNVFLGVGVAWMLAAFHHSYHGTVFRVDSGTLAFSVTLYCVMAVVAIILLLVRRCDSVGGELGGSAKFKLPTTVLLVAFFILYIILASFEAYEYISGF